MELEGNMQQSELRVSFLEKGEIHLKARLQQKEKAAEVTPLAFESSTTLHAPFASGSKTLACLHLVEGCYLLALVRSRFSRVSVVFCLRPGCAAPAKD